MDVAPRTEISLSERLSLLHAYWLSKRGARAMPTRSSIKPEEIGPLLPYTVLVEEIEGRLRYRLVGSEIASACGSDPARKFLDEVLPDVRYKIAARSYAMALGTARPLVSGTNSTTPTGATISITRLVLPLSDDGIHASMLLAGLDLDRSAPKESLGPGTSIHPSEVEIRFL